MNWTKTITKKKFGQSIYLRQGLSKRTKKIEALSRYDKKILPKTLNVSKINRLFKRFKGRNGCKYKPKN